MARIGWRQSSVYRRGYRFGPRRRRSSAVRVVLAGAVATLGEAAARFGWLGTPSGFPYPPEALAQQLFAIVPMDVFAVVIRWLGPAAQWVAFALMLLIWVILAGGFVGAAVAAAQRTGAFGAFLGAAAAGVLVQTAWWLAAPALAPGGWAAVPPGGLWPGAAIPAAAYGVAGLVAYTGRGRRW